MFRTKKTKTISTPVEEVLEVDLLIEDEYEQAWLEEEPELQQVTNIEFLTVDQIENELRWGKLIDYDGQQYNYQWDTKSNRIVRLIGLKVDKLTWDLCDDVLHKYFIKPEPPKVEEKILPKVEQAISGALKEINTAFKNLENKVEKTLAVKVASSPTPVQSQPTFRPQTVQSVPASDTPAISVADDDISANAMRFLQQSDAPDLGIDYMSL
jgi:hypothetical protein